jgi:hypothetical protein
LVCPAASLGVVIHQTAVRCSSITNHGVLEPHGSFRGAEAMAQHAEVEHGCGATRQLGLRTSRESDC